MLRSVISSFMSFRIERAANDPFPSQYDRRLPPELLTTIFAYLDFDDLMSVTHVCAFWRAAALAHSQLWSTIESGGNHGALAELLTRAPNVKRMAVVLEGRFRLIRTELQSLSARHDSGLLDTLALTGQAKLQGDFSALSSLAPVLSLLHLRAPFDPDYPCYEESTYEETDVEDNRDHRSRFVVYMPVSIFNGTVAVQLRTLILGRGVKFSVDNTSPFAFVERLDHTIHFFTLQDLQALQVMFPSLKHLRLKIDICEAHAASSALKHPGQQLTSLDLVYSPRPSHFYRTNNTRMQPLIAGYFAVDASRHTRLRFHKSCLRRATGHLSLNTWGRWDIHEAIVRSQQKSRECETCDVRHTDGRTVHVLRLPSHDIRCLPTPMWASLRRLTVSKVWLAAKTIPPMENLVELVILLERGVAEARPLSSNGDGIMAPLVCD